MVFSTTGMGSVQHNIVYCMQMYKRTEPTCCSFSNMPSTKLYKMTHRYLNLDLPLLDLCMQIFQHFSLYIFVIVIITT